MTMVIIISSLLFTIKKSTIVINDSVHVIKSQLAVFLGVCMLGCTGACYLEVSARILGRYT